MTTRMRPSVSRILPESTLQPRGATPGPAAPDGVPQSDGWHEVRMLLMEMPHIRTELLVTTANRLQKPNLIGEPLGSGIGESSPCVTIGGFNVLLHLCEADPQDVKVRV